MARKPNPLKPIKTSLDMPAQLKYRLDLLHETHGVTMAQALRLGASWVLDYYSRQPPMVPPASRPTTADHPMHTATKVQALAQPQVPTELSPSLGAMPLVPSNLDEAIDHPIETESGVPVTVRPTVVPKVGGALKSKVKLDRPTMAPPIQDDPVEEALSPWVSTQGEVWYSLRGFLELTKIDDETFQSVVDWGEEVDRDPMDREVILRETIEKVFATLPEYVYGPDVMGRIFTYMGSRS